MSGILTEFRLRSTKNCPLEPFLSPRPVLWTLHSLGVVEAACRDTSTVELSLKSLKSRAMKPITNLARL